MNLLSLQIKRNLNTILFTQTAKKHLRLNLHLYVVVLCSITIYYIKTMKHCPTIPSNQIKLHLTVDFLKTVGYMKLFVILFPSIIEINVDDIIRNYLTVLLRTRILCILAHIFKQEFHSPSFVKYLINWYLNIFDHIYEQIYNINTQILKISNTLYQYF